MRSSNYTIGLDLGDRRHHVCVLNGRAQPVAEEVIANTRENLLVLSARFPRATFIMETGTHSPWVSRFLEEQGHRVLVANARKLRAICSSVRPPRWAPDRLALRCAPGYAISTLPRSVRQPHQERRGGCADARSARPGGRIVAQPNQAPQ